MRHGSLFSGIGGWSVASDWMEWQTSFMCEWNENKQYVLRNLWPNSEIYGDITKTDFTKWKGQIDIITASTPCQPFSLAGKREGSNDVRHLWPETYRTIREIQPRFFVLENVPGLVNWSKGMVFKQIITDLENEGYEVLPFLLPACGVNAPHKRERIWIVANSQGNTRVNAFGNERYKTQKVQEKRPNECFITSDPGLFRSEISKQQTTGIKQCSEGIITNTNSNQRHKRGVYQEGRKETERHSCSCNTWDESGTNWLNFPTVSPLRNGDDGISCESLRMLIRKNSNGLLTEEEENQIISKAINKYHNEVIAAGGDAVVPEVVYQIFKAIQQYEDNLNVEPEQMK